MADWEIEPGVDITVRASPNGPYDAPSGPWFDLTPYVHGESGVHIGRGRSDEFDHFQAARCQLELRNNNREFDPTSIGGRYLQMSGAAGQGASTPDDSKLDIVSVLDIRAEIAPTTWRPASQKMIVSKFRTSDDNRSYALRLNIDGRLSLVTSTNGTSGGQFTTSSLIPISAEPGEWQVVRVTFDASIRETWYYTGPTLDGPWTTIGGPNTGTATSIFSGASPVWVGNQATESVNAIFDGKIGAVEIRDGIGGVAYADPDFRGQPVGTTSFTDTWRTWTVAGSAAIVGTNPSPFEPILKPRARLEVIVTWDDAAHTLFAGYVEGWPQSWTNTTGTVQISATDAIGILATDSASTAAGSFHLDSPITGRLDNHQTKLFGYLDRQFSGERIGTLLQLAGYSTGLAIDRGLSLLHEIQPEGNILQAINDSEEAEGGFFFATKNGGIEFRDRHSRFNHPRMNTVQHTFTDSQYGNVEVDFSTTKIINDARVSRSQPELAPNESTEIPEGGPDPSAVLEGEQNNEQIVIDHQSVFDYGRKSYQVEVPVVADGETLGRAEFLVSRYSTPKARPGEISIKPRRDMATLFTPLLTLELLDRVQITRLPLGVGAEMMFLGLTEQISHSFSNDDWTTTLAVSLVDVDEGSTLLRLDDTEFGKLDNYSLAY